MTIITEIIFVNVRFFEVMIYRTTYEFITKDDS